MRIASTIILTPFPSTARSLAGAQVTTSCSSPFSDFQSPKFPLSRSAGDPPFLAPVSDLARRSRRFVHYPLVARWLHEHRKKSDATAIGVVERFGRSARRRLGGQQSFVSPGPLVTFSRARKPLFSGFCSGSMTPTASRRPAAAAPPPACPAARVGARYPAGSSAGVGAPPTDVSIKPRLSPRCCARPGVDRRASSV